MVQRVMAWTSALSSFRVMRDAGLSAKIRLSSSLHWVEIGRIERRKSGFERYARKVSSEGHACFHGFLPHVRLTRLRIGK